MVTETDLNVIVANVLSETRYSNCRLCLGDVKGDYVRLEDHVTDCADESETFRLSELLSTFLGDEICDTILGLEAVCANCVESVFQTYRFIEKCKKSTALLQKIFNNLSETLNVEIDTTNGNQKMYITITEDESKVVLQDNTVNCDEPKEKDTRKKRYFCEECEDNFETITSFKNHNKACHNLLTCRKCLLTFGSDEELISHKETGHMFKCPSCDQCKSTEENLKDHIDKVHTIYMCKDCGKSCEGLDKLHAHESKHNTIKNECPKCGKTYITKDFFMKHVQLCLEDRIDPHPYRAKITKSYICDTCGKGYSTPGGLKVHNKFAHGDGKHHICEQCGKKFTAPSYLKIHMVKHTGAKNFKCNICGNNFVTKEALLYHTRRHTGEKPYSCKLCTEKFVNASARAEHIKYKHMSPSLTCDVCPKKCYTESFLRQHRSRHDDPASKLYIGRNTIPPNVPSQQNRRVKLDIENDSENDSEMWSKLNEQ